MAPASRAGDKALVPAWLAADKVQALERPAGDKAQVLERPAGDKVQVLEWPAVDRVQVPEWLAGGTVRVRVSPVPDGKDPVWKTTEHCRPAGMAEVAAGPDKTTESDNKEPAVWRTEPDEVGWAEPVADKARKACGTARHCAGTAAWDTDRSKWFRRAVALHRLRIRHTKCPMKSTKVEIIIFLKIRRHDDGPLPHFKFSLSWSRKKKE